MWVLVRLATVENSFFESSSQPASQNRASSFVFSLWRSTSGEFYLQGHDSIKIPRLQGALVPDVARYMGRYGLIWITPLNRAVLSTLSDALRTVAPNALPVSV